MLNNETARFRDALHISEGACNPCGIAHSLVNACQECIGEGRDQKSDPAVQLIVSQLAYLCGIWNGISIWDKGEWHDASVACYAKVEAAKREAEALV